MLTTDQLAFVPIVWYFYPETSNYSLEDIDRLFLPPEMADHARRVSLGEIHDGSDESKGEFTEKRVEKV